MSTPFVSVILPVYNCEKFIVDAIDSILSQTYTKFELLIIDDGSTDRSMEKIAQFKDERISVYSRENRGLGNTLNELIKHSRGKYIARMDADDICCENRLYDQVKYLEENSNVGLVGGQVTFFNSEVGPREIIQRFPLDHNSILSGLLKQRFYLCHPAIMFRACLVRTAVKYRVQGSGEDLDFFLQMALVTRVANLENMVLKYRITMNSLGMTQRQNLNKNYAWAIKSYHQRSGSSAVLDMNEFEKEYSEAQNIYEQSKLFFKDCSKIYYRRYILAKIGGHDMYAYMFLLLAAFLNPARAFSKLKFR